MISMNNQQISLSLPKGDVLPFLAEQFKQIEFPIKGYESDNRTYRPVIDTMPVRAKIMAEKDVALQVAAGNYDIGFCGQDWVHEHTVRFRGSNLQILFSLKHTWPSIYACCGKGGNINRINDLKSFTDTIEIVSEYPNMAEHFAINNRIRRFKIFPAWGSVEAYPPEHAHIVILKAINENDFDQKGLFMLDKLLNADLSLVVNQNSYKEKDLTPVLKYLLKLEVN